MAEYRDHHATIFVAPEAAGAIEAVRREWDPGMAAQIAAHVTVAYPREAPLIDLLVERLRIVTARMAPFRLRLGERAWSGHSEDAVVVKVEDIEGGCRRLREAILRSPFHAVTVSPHVTLVHPRTSRRGREFWDTGWRYEGVDFTADEVTVTGFDGAAWVTLLRFALKGRERRSA